MYTTKTSSANQQLQSASIMTNLQNISNFLKNVTFIFLSFQGKNCPSMYKEMYYKGKHVFTLRIISCTSHFEHCPLSEEYLYFIHTCNTLQFLTVFTFSGVRLSVPPYLLSHVVLNVSCYQLTLETSSLSNMLQTTDNVRHKVSVLNQQLSLHKKDCVSNCYSAPPVDLQDKGFCVDYVD
jgi:hypothetical protein